RRDGRRNLRPDAHRRFEGLGGLADALQQADVVALGDSDRMAQALRGVERRGRGIDPRGVREERAACRAQRRRVGLRLRPAELGRTEVDETLARGLYLRAGPGLLAPEDVDVVGPVLHGCEELLQAGADAQVDRTLVTGL